MWKVCDHLDVLPMTCLQRAPAGTYYNKDCGSSSQFDCNKAKYIVTDYTNCSWYPAVNVMVYFPNDPLCCVLRTQLSQTEDACCDSDMTLILNNHRILIWETETPKFPIHDYPTAWRCFLHYWPFFRESTGYQWFPLTNDQWCRPCFLMSLVLRSYWTNSRAMSL